MYLKKVLKDTLSVVKDFVYKAGTLIVFFSAILWLLTNLSCGFSYLNGEYGYDGYTQILIEDDTISTLKISLKNLFNNEITSISQDLYETDYNTINFSFTYNNEKGSTSYTIADKHIALLSVRTGKHG